MSMKIFIQNVCICMLFVDNEMKSVFMSSHHVKKSKELSGIHPIKNEFKHPKVLAGLVREGCYMLPYIIYVRRCLCELKIVSNIRY